MIILHVCSIDNNKANGISNVVPEHFINQKKLEKVALLNCNNIKIEKLENEENVFYVNNYKNIKKLPEPFNKPDLVIFHGIYIPYYIKIYKILRKNNIPYIILPHGSLTKDAQKIKRIKKIIGNKLLFNRFVYNAKAIQFLSVSEQQMSSKFKQNSFIMGNGMNIPNIEKKEYNDKLKIIYVGRYAVYHKGLDILIDSCEKISDFMKKNGITISLYGAGNDGIEYLKKIVNEKRLSSVIEVNGPLFGKEKMLKIIKHDIFIQTSRLEGQPLGVMEAMALGMPIIASEGTTFGNIVKENGIGFMCSTVDEIAETIREVVNSKEKLINMGKNAKKYAINNFSWNIVSIETIKKYKNIV